MLQSVSDGWSCYFDVVIDRQPAFLPNKEALARVCSTKRVTHRA